MWYFLRLEGLDQSADRYYVLPFLWQDFIVLHLVRLTTLPLVRKAHTVRLVHLFLIQLSVLLGFIVPLAVLYPNHVQQELSLTQQGEAVVILVQMVFTASLLS